MPKHEVAQMVFSKILSYIITNIYLSNIYSYYYINLIFLVVILFVKNIVFTNANIIVIKIPIVKLSLNHNENIRICANRISFAANKVKFYMLKYLQRL